MGNEFNAGDIIAEIQGPGRFWVYGFMNTTYDSYYVLRKPHHDWSNTITGGKEHVEGNYVKVGEFIDGVEIFYDK